MSKPEDEATRLQEQGQEAVERGEYAVARDRFREAARIAPPSADTLDGLHVAQELERLVYLQELAAQYPANVDVAVAVAQHHFTEGRSAQAITAYTKPLERCSDEATSIGVRSGRFSAAIRGRNYEVMIEDFVALWARYGRLPHPVKARRPLLRGIASLCDPDAAEPLGRLADNLKEDALLKRLINLKVTELQAMREIWERGDDALS